VAAVIAPLWLALRRLGWAALVVAGVTAISFVIAYLLPGDPARMLVGPQASAADVEHARRIHGLDRPAPAQLGSYARRLLHRGAAHTPDARRDPAHRSCAAYRPGLHLDLGYSFHYRRPVVDLIAAKAPRSAELAAAALLAQLTLGFALGLLAASRRGTRWDEAAVAATLLAVSAPSFALGLALQYLLAYRLRILPYDGHGATPSEQLRSLVLPALTLGILGCALYARVLREELGAALQQDFARTARAKGASPARVLLVHALRSALLPIATLAALDLGTLVGGAIVTEKLFRWPGLGQMAVEALQNRDGPLIVGAVLFAAAAIVAATLVLDLVCALLDPRLRERR